MWRLVCLRFALVWLCMCLADRCSEASQADKHIPYWLESNYQLLTPNVIPGSKGQPVKVKFRFSLTEILDLDANGELDFTAWVSLTWSVVDSDYNWDQHSHLFPNLTSTSVHLPATSVWTPDIVCYNQIKPVELLSPATVIVDVETGSAMLMTSQRMRTRCNGGHCSLKFGSWVYNGFQLDLETGDDSGNLDTSEFRLVEQSRFTVGSPATVERNVVHYACCPEPYPDILIRFPVVRREETRRSSSSSWGSWLTGRR